MSTCTGSVAQGEFSVALLSQRPKRLLGTGSPGRPPQILHRSWALKKSVKGESVHWFLSGSSSATLQVFYYLALHWLQPLQDVSLQIVWHFLLIFQFSFNYLALHWLQPLQDVSLQIVWHFLLIFQFSFNYLALHWLQPLQDVSLQIVWHFLLIFQFSFNYLALHWLQPLQDVSLQIVWHFLLIFQFSFNYLALHWLQPLQDVSLQIVWHFLLIFHAASFCWQEIFSGLSNWQSFLQKFASLSYSFGPDFMRNLHFICLSFVSCLACTSGSYRDGNLLLLELTFLFRKKMVVYKHCHDTSLAEVCS